MSYFLFQWDFHVFFCTFPSIHFLDTFLSISVTLGLSIHFKDNSSIKFPPKIHQITKPFNQTFMRLCKKAKLDMHLSKKDNIFLVLFLRFVHIQGFVSKICIFINKYYMIFFNKLNFLFA